MDKKYWFRAKSFGWGWYPCTWQGWSVLVMYVFSMISNFVFVNHYVHSASDFLMQFFPQTYILTVFLIIVCYAKGEKPAWHWGFKKDNVDKK